MEPLAYRIRPKKLIDVVGQEDILQKGSMLYNAVSNDNLFSCLFWGPPGCGKTSLANVIAHETKSKFIKINAVSSGVKDLREIIKKVKENQDSLFRTKTILFIDEIHRFNKSQQDYLLPFVENGTIIFIGATTENPSFEVNSALLSRLQVFILTELNESDIAKLVHRAIETDEIVKPFKDKILEEDILYLSKKSFGDARFALNTIEQLLPYFQDLPKDKDQRHVEFEKLIKNKLLRYDKNGEEHYNIISALHKSMRDSDVEASIYWTVRLLEAGEDPKYVVRRMIRFASEDIGISDINALKLAIAVKENVVFVGMPESATAIVELAVYLAKAPKDNRCYMAYLKTKEVIEKTGPLGVPLHLRNAPTKFMENIGYGKGYKYAHNFKNAKVEQEHLPEGISREEIGVWS